jgi:hypothetical protein
LFHYALQSNLAHDQVLFINYVLLFRQFCMTDIVLIYAILTSYRRDATGTPSF